MNKLILCALIILFSLPFSVKAADSVEEKCWNTFLLDHKELKDTVSTIRIMKRIGTLKEAFYEEKKIFTPSAEDKARGFAIFKKSSGEDLFPNSLPSKADLAGEYSISGVRGEFEPFIICILPEKDLSGVLVSVSDLKKENGKAIPKDQIEIKHARYEYVQVGSAWMLKARYLLPGPADVPSGVARAFLFTVKIPEDAEPGLYKGKALITAGGAAAEAPVSLEVLPFDWAPLSPLHTNWMWDYNGYLASEVMEKRFEDIRDHGMNTYCGGLPAQWKVENGEMKMDFSTAERIAPLLKKYGINKWMINSPIYNQIARTAGAEMWSPLHRKLFGQMLEQTKAKAKKDGWPELIWTIEETGEAGHEGGVGYGIFEDMMGFAEAVNFAGIDSHIAWAAHGDVNPRYMEIVPKLTYSSCMAPVTAFEHVIKNVNALKKPLLLYDCGMNRFAFGALVKQKNALGNSQFWYCATKYGVPAAQYASCSCSVYDDNMAPIDTYEWEQMREGVDDYRYIWTLEQALAEWKDKASPEFLAGRAALDSVLKMEFKPREGIPAGTEVEFMSEEMVNYDGSKLDAMRARLVNALRPLKARAR